MKHYSLISLFLILSVSGCSCALKGHEGTDGFDPYISAIPDSMATGSQITVKKALENIIYTGVSVEDDRYVFNFTKDDFSRLGISEKYCKWLKCNMRKEAGNYRKLLRQNPVLKSGTSLEEMFESAKKEYLENPEKGTEQIMPTTDIFRYGSPVQCSEDNIKNLFGNWTALVTGSSDIRLLSYNYEGPAKDRKQLWKYVNHNHSAEMPYWSYSSDFDSNGNAPHIVTGEPLRQKAGNRKFAAKALMAHFVSVGDHVYSVKFSAEGKKYVYYIFVKPDTNRVVTKFNAFGCSIPDMAV